MFDYYGPIHNTENEYTRQYKIVCENFDQWEVVADQLRKKFEIAVEVGKNKLIVYLGKDEGVYIGDVDEWLNKNCKRWMGNRVGKLEGLIREKLKHPSFFANSLIEFHEKYGREQTKSVVEKYFTVF